VFSLKGIDKNSFNDPLIIRDDPGEPLAGKNWQF